MMYDNDVFSVTLFDRKGNETYHTKIATFERVAEWLADKVLERSASRAIVVGQHGQCGEADLDAQYDRLVAEGYIH